MRRGAACPGIPSADSAAGPENRAIFQVCEVHIPPRKPARFVQVCEVYMTRGHFAEIIALLENGPENPAIFQGCEVHIPPQKPHDSCRSARCT